MKKIPLTQGKFALVDDEDFDRVNAFRWRAYFCRNTFYAKGQPNGVQIKMHRFILGASPDDPMVDHIDHDGLNNQKSNLRFTTHKENGLGRSGLQKNNSSGVSGVYWMKKFSRWRARVTYDLKRYDLGMYVHLEDAAMAVVNFVPKDLDKS